MSTYICSTNGRTGVAKPMQIITQHDTLHKATEELKLRVLYLEDIDFQDCFVAEIVNRCQRQVELLDKDGRTFPTCTNE